MVSLDAFGFFPNILQLMVVKHAFCVAKAFSKRLLSEVSRIEGWMPLIICKSGSKKLSIGSGGKFGTKWGGYFYRNLEQGIPDEIKDYLHEEISKVINNEDFEEGLYANLTGGYGGVDANYIRIKLENAIGIR